MKVLAIETSCDESAVAIYDGEKGIVADVLHSQVDIHTQYGGVVPELASRDHIRKLLPLIKQAMSQSQLSAADIDAVAYTKGPGLYGALLVGATVGRALSFGWQIPSIGVHHMEGHLLAPMLESDPPDFPFIALLVSGGHTLLVEVKRLGCYHILGNTLDDAVGEAFDKTAKILGLGYPGGPALARLAEQGHPGQFQLPRPMLNRPGLDFSFSGLKTHVAKVIRAHAHDQQSRADIAYAFQLAVVDTLLNKCRRALKQTGLTRLVAAGGVSANVVLRKGLDDMLAELGGKAYFPRPQFCTDNGAMIAYAGYLRCKAGQYEGLEITPKARWPLDQLASLDSRD